MLVQLVDKQRRAVSVVKTALLGVGISGRSVCVTVNSWVYSHSGESMDVGVFVSPPIGEDVEPFYETGETVAGAVKKVINSIKGRANDAKTGIPEVAPF
ncbi:MAG: hypothetical protein ACXWT1_10065 [Methylobacter sp.]